MTKDCSLNYKFSTWKLQAQYMLCAQITFLFMFWHSEQFMYTTCSELVVFMYWTGKSMNNLLSYCGLVDARIRGSDKDLPVPKQHFHIRKSCNLYNRKWIIDKQINNRPDPLYVKFSATILRAWVVPEVKITQWFSSLVLKNLRISCLACLILAFKSGKFCKKNVNILEEYKISIL